MTPGPMARGGGRPCPTGPDPARIFTTQWGVSRGSPEVRREAQPSRSTTVQIRFNGRLAAVNSVADRLLWTHLDHLGTLRINTDSTGSVPLKLGQPDRDWCYPYGEQINTPVDAVTRRFTGQERDGESELDHFGARHYSPTLGRFLTTDPIGAFTDDPQSLNKFAYCLSNPHRYVDRDGRFVLPVIIVGGAVIGAAWGGVDA